MRAFVSVSDRILALTQDIDRIYRRIDHRKGIKEARKAKVEHYNKLHATLDADQRRLHLTYDDATHELRRCCENAYFDVGFACGQLLTEESLQLSRREQRLADAFRAAILESGLSRRCILRILLGMSQGVAAGGEIFQPNPKKRKSRATSEK